jgi:CBS domain-containing protein
MIQLPTAQQWMIKVRRTFKATDDMRTALDDLIGNHFPVVPVIDERGCLVGILSEKDALRTICRWAHEGVTGGTVGDHMSLPEHKITVDQDLLSTAAEFITCNFSSLPVVDRDRLVGTITRQAVLSGLSDWDRRQQKEMERLRTAKSGHERPSTIADLQRTVASHTKEQLSSLFKHH